MKEVIEMTGLDEKLFAETLKVLIRIMKRIGER